jgi:hypothetical protein
VGVAVRRPEDMEMRIAALRRRHKERFDTTIVSQKDILDSVNGSLGMLLGIGQIAACPADRLH